MDEPRVGPGSLPVKGRALMLSGLRWGHNPRPSVVRGFCRPPTGWSWGQNWGSLAGAYLPTQASLGWRQAPGFPGRIQAFLEGCKVQALADLSQEWDHRIFQQMQDPCAAWPELWLGPRAFPAGSRVHMWTDPSQGWKHGPFCGLQSFHDSQARIRGVTAGPPGDG